MVQFSLAFWITPCGVATYDSKRDDKLKSIVWVLGQEIQVTSWKAKFGTASGTVFPTTERI